MAVKEKPFDQRLLIFAEAYLANGRIASAAAIEAGYSPKAARDTGYRLVKDPRVAAIIAERQAELQNKYELTTERTLKEIARLAYSDARKLYKPDGTLAAMHELDDDAAATVSSVETEEIAVDGAVIGTTKKMKVWNKNQALDMAAKILGLYEKDNTQKQPVVLNLNLAGRAN
jgi:phage terminase small subunit